MNKKSIATTFAKEHYSLLVCNSQIYSLGCIEREELDGKYFILIEVLTKS